MKGKQYLSSKRAINVRMSHSSSALCVWNQPAVQRNDRTDVEEKYLNRHCKAP